MTSGFPEASVSCRRKTDTRTKFLLGARQQVQFNHLSKLVRAVQLRTRGQQVNRSPPLVQDTPVLQIPDADTKISVNIGVNKSKCEGHLCTATLVQKKPYV